jgi:hypothetical protein
VSGAQVTVYKYDRRHSRVFLVNHYDRPALCEPVY